MDRADRRTVLLGASPRDLTRYQRKCDHQKERQSLHEVLSLSEDCVPDTAPLAHSPPHAWFLRQDPLLPEQRGNVPSRLPGSFEPLRNFPQPTRDFAGSHKFFPSRYYSKPVRPDLDPRHPLLQMPHRPLPPPPPPL